MRLPTYQQLSAEQDAVLNLPLSNSYLVAGPPGTGKTVLALYRAKQLEDSGSNVEMIVYSKLLRQYLNSAISELQLGAKAKTFHSWFSAFYRRLFRVDPPRAGEWTFDWARVFEALSRRPPAAGDLVHLVVDEAQDMPHELFMVLRLISATRTVFADENQRLLEHNSSLDEIARTGGVADEVQMLHRNYRNTFEIAALASHFYSGLRTGRADPPERHGPTPVLIHHPRVFDSVDFIVRHERTFGDRQIGVLTPNNKVRTRLVNRLKDKTRNPVQTYAADAILPVDFDQPGVTVVNYQSAKGLEFDTVFLPELQDAAYMPGIPDQRMAFYVLCSRAREELYLMYSGEGDPPILDMFPNDNTLERR